MDFKQAFYTLMTDEGLWILTNDPKDPGGQTWSGISRKAHPGCPLIDDALPNLTIAVDGEGGLLDARHDEKGRMVYNVDWRQFSGGHKAILMCVAAAVMEEPLSDRWLRAMTTAMGARRPVVQAVPWAFVNRALGEDMKNFERQRERNEQAKQIRTGGTNGRHGKHQIHRGTTLAS